MELTQEIAKRIGSDGGGALIIDYGLNGIVSDSLQVSCNTKSTLSCFLFLASSIHLLLPLLPFAQKVGTVVGPRNWLRKCHLYFSMLNLGLGQTQGRYFFLLDYQVINSKKFYGAYCLINASVSKILSCPPFKFNVMFQLKRKTDYFS